MNKILKFKKLYFLLTIILLIVEILIALYVHDSFIRPYIGDFLVVILIYCFFKSFLDTPVLQTAILVLIFSYLVETLQYFDIVNCIGLQNSKLARIIIGSTFQWIDFIAYTAGIIFVMIVEKISLIARLWLKQKN